MICEVCRLMLEEQRGYIWKGTWDLFFQHQIHGDGLRVSAEQDCSLCRIIWAKVKDNPKYKKDGPLVTKASLSSLGTEAYRLDFKLDDNERVSTFILKPRGELDDHHRSRTWEDDASHQQDKLSGITRSAPRSTSTSSDEVMDLAKSWIDQCLSLHECPRASSSQDDLPTRLLDLQSASPDSEAMVRVVLTRDTQQLGSDIRYVTLSHCWGNVTSAYTLNPRTLRTLQNGVAVCTLPKTFQEAIAVASRLAIRYLWIDSLCIFQVGSDRTLGGAEQSDFDEMCFKDWLSESTRMHHIYLNSYCNISATASSDSNGGLFVDRNPQHLLIDEVALNTYGMGLGQRQEICTIIDASFWEDRVEGGPVNRRGWVLQERLMAPRVLHFCKDQLAFECCQLDAAETFPGGLPEISLLATPVTTALRLKHTVLGSHGDPDAHWNRVVEVYSRMQLTQSKDKLIALAGIAKVMQPKFGNEDVYVAGLWSSHLGVQMLWRVNRGDHGQYASDPVRPREYRAPSFSWASVDTLRGIKFGQHSKDDLLIAVDNIQMKCRNNDPFGLVEEGSYIQLCGQLGVLKKVKVTDSRRFGSSAVYWRLMRKGKGYGQKHSTVYLDSRMTDTHIFGAGAQIYCLPAAWERDGSIKHLTCLLLQLQASEPPGTYKRIGLTRLFGYRQTDQEEVCRPSDGPNGPTIASAREGEIKIRLI